MKNGTDSVRDWHSFSNVARVALGKKYCPIEVTHHQENECLMHRSRFLERWSLPPLSLL